MSKIIISNTILEPAINLYRKYEFKGDGVICFSIIRLMAYFMTLNIISKVEQISH